ncbi:MAG TPA: FAD-dependent oxidoreductase, partial [Alphaproteobacteria bacterium]|nr:FAD-dependent oxidoreductase [Alphaproteobacteria bacterium]
MNGPDVAIVGGGLAGAAAAARLAAAGRRVVLLEREAAAHDKVCGEFVSVEAGQDLAGLGIDLAAAGAVAIRRLRLIAGRRCAVAALPFAASGLSRRILDGLVLDRAAAAGAELRRGAAVRAMASAEGAWRLEAGGGAVIAPTVLLATGKHDLRGWPRPPGRKNDLIGFKMHFAGADPLPDCIDVGWFGGGYAGLQSIEGGRLNLCLVVEQGRYEALGRDWRRLMAALAAELPPLAERLAAAAPCWERPLAIARIPYGWVHDGGGDPPGLYRLGDQFAVIPSFAGDGMAIALATARDAAAAVLAGMPAAEYHRRLHRRLAGQIGLAHRLA